MSEIKVSRIAWTRFRRFLWIMTILVGAGGGIMYSLTSGSFILDADGLLTREYVTIATPYPARISQMLVRPGDKVTVGQRISVVDSPTLTRALAELSAEKAKITSRLAQLKGRSMIAELMLPLAEANLAEVQTFLDRLKTADRKGLATGRTLYDIALQRVTASERAMTLKAETESVKMEIQGNIEALREVSAAYDNLQIAYNHGALLSPVDGYVGGDVRSVGQVLEIGARVANIHSGDSFVLAYLPENYLFNVEEGQRVGIRIRGENVPSRIERVLPVTEALPPEFQLPNRQRERGQLVRISIPDGLKNDYAVDQKVRVRGCLTHDCANSFGSIITYVHRGVANLVEASEKKVRAMIVAAPRGDAVGLGQPNVTP